MLDGDDGLVFDGDEAGAFGAGFADVAALDAAGEDDPGLLAENFAAVDVAEGPVVVALCLKLRNRAGCVAGMAGASIDACVEHSDVEQPGVRWRVVAREVVEDLASRKALTVDDDGEVSARRCAACPSGAR